MPTPTPSNAQHLTIWNRLKPQPGTQLTPQAHEIFIYGPIINDMDRELYSWFYDTEFFVSPGALAQQLAAIDGDTVVVRINSPGGSVAATAAVRNLLLQAQADGRTLHTVVDGLAASGASILALSAPLERRTIAELGQYFIHNAHTLIAGVLNGDHQDADHVAEKAAQRAHELRALDETIQTVYVQETTADPDQVAAWMDQETFLSAAQALEYEFAHAYFKGTLPAAHAEQEPQGLAYKAVASLSGGFPFAQLAAPPAPPPAPPTKEPTMSRPTDDLVRQTLNLPTPEAITDDHRDQALQALAERDTQARQTLFVAQRDAVLARHAARGVVTAAECEAHKARLAEAKDPAWALSFLDQTLSAAAPPTTDPATPQGHSQALPAAGPALAPTAQADLFRAKVAELQQSGLTFGDAIIQAKNQLGVAFYEAYAYRTHETTGSPGVGV